MCRNVTEMCRNIIIAIRVYEMKLKTKETETLKIIAQPNPVICNVCYNTYLFTRLFTECSIVDTC